MDNVQGARRASSRRVGSRVDGPSRPQLGTLNGGSAGVWLLRALGVGFVWPLIISLFGAEGTAALGNLAGIVLLFLAAHLAAQGNETEAELAGRRLTRQPTIPYRLAASASTGLAALFVSMAGSGDGLILGLLFAGLAFFAARLVLGEDAKVDKAAVAEAAKRAGVAPERVVSALEEAHGKIRDIEAQSKRIHSVELKSRLARICEGARAVLRQIEKDPRDISRARRFLVTYLDGTRDIVTKYAAQQQDVADTPLAANIRRVLETVERVIGEQIDVLKRSDRLDLEVTLDVLETQLKNEGVH